MKPVKTLVYKPAPDRLQTRQIWGAWVALSGGGLGCLVFLLGLLLFKATANWLLGLTISAGALMGAVAFISDGLSLALSGRRDEVQLRPDALAYTHGPRATILPLAEITRLESRWAQGWRGRGHWALVIVDRFGQAIELDIPCGHSPAPFEVRPLLRDLFSRLPGPVEVDLRLQNYVATGQMKW
ncbi:MAG: hypothetical protein Fur0044_28190 [Anaerolineae bacterium]|nr:hypothetical protein [Anaerolineales bacterium]MCQ3979391.1 hypothetical protein [Anaerolineae bacterium]